MVLSLAGWLYGKIANIRNALYDRGTLRSYDLGARTISIGNITAGGTGKTPLVARVAEILADAGESVCILTRGYGRESTGRVLVSDGSKVLVDARTGGDEPVELGLKTIGHAVVVADADRVAAAAWAKEEFGVTAFILDDGFQHRRAKRDLDIVCVDAMDPFGFSNTFPREPLDNLRRADVIVLTRSNLVSETSSIESRIAEFTPSASLFRGSSIIQLETTKPVYAFCGLGNPESFFESLRQTGYQVKGTATFPDHHKYTRADLDGLERSAAAAGAEFLLTTAKDAMNLKDLDGVKSKDFSYWVIGMRIELDNEEAFRDLITSSS
jgi:tetraacyldisaccharide 4'-kinase